MILKTHGWAIVLIGAAAALSFTRLDGCAVWFDKG